MSRLLCLPLAPSFFWGLLLLELPKRQPPPHPTPLLCTPLLRVSFLLHFGSVPRTSPLVPLLCCPLASSLPSTSCLGDFVTGCVSRLQRRLEFCLGPSHLETEARKASLSVGGEMAQRAQMELSCQPAAALRPGQAQLLTPWRPSSGEHGAAAFPSGSGALQRAMCLREERAARSGPGLPFGSCPVMWPGLQMLPRSRLHPLEGKGPPSFLSIAPRARPLSGAVV